MSDYLGTPVEAYNSKGKLVWSCELDIYGRVKDFTEIKNIGGYACEEEYSVDFIPHRYQGQRHDLVSELYYNRFRYYDPSTGMYTQQDPIGLAGGNPTLYAYVNDPNGLVDIFGLKGSLAKPGEDLFVGTYSQSYSANVASGLNETHTAHHVVQNALNGKDGIPTSRGITINISRELHEKTRTFRKPVDKTIGSLRDHLAADVKD